MNIKRKAFAYILVKNILSLAIPLRIAEVMLRLGVPPIPVFITYGILLYALPILADSYFIEKRNWLGRNNSIRDLVLIMGTVLPFINAVLGLAFGVLMLHAGPALALSTTARMLFAITSGFFLVTGVAISIEKNVDERKPGKVNSSSEEFQKIFENANKCAMRASQRIESESAAQGRQIEVVHKHEFDVNKPVTAEHVTPDYVRTEYWHGTSWNYGPNRKRPPAHDWSKAGKGNRLGP